MSVETLGLLDGPSGILSEGLVTDEGALYVATVEPARIPDDGGSEMSATASWPTDQGVRVWVDLLDGSDPIPCYSGEIGAGFVCQAVDGVLSWVAPPLPVGGPYNLIFQTEDEVGNWFADGIDVIHRSFRTTLYTLRSAFPPPRDVGPYTIEGEE